MRIWFRFVVPVLALSTHLGAQAADRPRPQVESEPLLVVPYATHGLPFATTTARHEQRDARPRKPNSTRAVVPLKPAWLPLVEELSRLSPPGKLTKKQVTALVSYAVRNRGKAPLLAEWACRRVLLHDCYQKTALAVIRKLLAQASSGVVLQSPVVRPVIALVDRTKHHQMKCWAIYALDMCVERNGRIRKGPRRLPILRLKVADYYGFGAPLHAPVDGIVTDVHRGADDNAVGKIAKGYSNYVRITTAAGFEVTLAHLKKGSIPAKVRPGRRVARGDRIGAIGNSGQSSVPHLHIQMVDPDDIGWPMHWQNIETHPPKSKRWNPVDGGVIREGHFMRPVAAQPKRQRQTTGK